MSARSELTGEWAPPSRGYLRALLLWLDYYADCDAFDGTRGPVPFDRRAASAWFARQRRASMLADAMENGVTDEEMTEAKGEAGRLDDLHPDRRAEIVESLRRQVKPPITPA